MLLCGSVELVVVRLESEPIPEQLYDRGLAYAAGPNNHVQTIAERDVEAV